MIAYFEGGPLDGRALPDVSKKAKSISNPMSDGRRAWYRQTGKKVTVTVPATKEKASARVYRFDCVRDIPPAPAKRVRFKKVSAQDVAGPAPSGVRSHPSGCVPPSGVLGQGEENLSPAVDIAFESV